MIQTIATALGGLGIFFAGMYLLKENLKKLAGRRFKQLVAVWTRGRFAGLGLGVVAGGVMQSTTAVTFILASMIASGLINVGGALPIITGANVGATFLILIATLNIQLFVLFVLGIAGISFTFDRLSEFRTVASAIFGVGLVFFGLKMLQTGVVPLTQEPWFASLLTLAGPSLIIPLLVASVLTVLAQSSTSVVLLVITLATAGGLTFEQAMMGIYGANLGSSAQNYLLSSSLNGRPKQVAMYQISFNLITAAVMLPLFVIERFGHVPLIEELVQSISNTLATRLALVQVTFNVVGAVLMTTLLPTMRRFLAHRFPPLPDEDDAEPVYIHDQAAQEPDSALDLARLEQRRLASYLPRYLDVARHPSRDGPTRLDRQNRSFTVLGTTVRDFLTGLREAPFDAVGYDRLNRAINLQRLLDGLNETLVELARTSRLTDDAALARRLLANVVEGIDAVLLTMVDALADGSGEDRALFRAMTRHRGEVMHGLREAYLAADAQLSTAEKGTILIVTNLAERALWLLGQIAEQEEAVRAG
jgi:phosphate:Na+ symporter